MSATIARNVRLLGAASLAALAAACASGGKSLDNAGKSVHYKDAVAAYSAASPDLSGLDPVAAAAYWGTQYDRDPRNPDSAVNYSSALRKIGSVEKAVTVMTRATTMSPDRADVDLEMARALIESNRAFEAVRYVEEAAAARPDDWKALSVYGVALDQIGEHELARTKYELALLITPGNPNVLNNKALSFAMSGDLSKASEILRVAATKPGADARMRQNLALVLAIKGDLTQAERLARSDLPPQVADGNMDYFRTLMVQPAYWQSASSDAYDAPAFDTAPVFEPAPATAPAPLPQLKEEPKPETAPAKPMASGETVQPVTKTSAEGAPEVLAPELKPE